MNIFLTDPCPRQCAINLDDKRVNKMLLETAQLLSSAMKIQAKELGVSVPHGLYENTHVNHPCAVWTRSSRAAFRWMLEHGLCLADEYAYRYNTRLSHKSLLDDNRYSLHNCVRILDIAGWESGRLFPEDGKPLLFNFNSSGQTAGQDVFENYRLCMSNKWLNLDKSRPLFTKRYRPRFYKLIKDFRNGVQTS